MKTNNMLSIVRVAALLGVATAAFCLTLCEPKEDVSESLLILSKVAGLGLCYLTYRLYKSWSKTDPLIRKYDRWCDSADDAPNPLNAD